MTKRHTTGDMTSAIYKVPFRFNGVRKRRKRERRTLKKRNTFSFLCKKRAALYSVAITAFLSDTRTLTHSFIFSVVDQ